jgi:hypothetical protein
VSPGGCADVPENPLSCHDDRCPRPSGHTADAGTTIVKSGRRSEAVRGPDLLLHRQRVLHSVCPQSKLLQDLRDVLEGEAVIGAGSPSFLSHSGSVPSGGSC